MSSYLYIDENSVRHEVRIHNFDRNDTNTVRIIGNHTLNPSDKTYPDKKWVNVCELYEPVKFSKEFIKNNSF